MTLSSLIAAAIDNPGDYNDDDDGLTPGILPEGTLREIFAVIASRVDDGVIYDIPIDSDIVWTEEDTTYNDIKTRGQNVTIHIHSASVDDIKTMSFGSNIGQFFVVWDNITLKLSNIKLQGTNNNNYALLAVVGGTLVIEDGTLITGNTHFTGSGGGILSDKGGNIIMNGGEISNNNAADTNHGAGGGICFVDAGSFIMNGGIISGNRAKVGGGGIYIEDSATIVMNGGEISGNSATNGGGVLINGTGSFTMNGGTIADNTADDTGGGIYAIDTTLTTNGGGSRIVVTIKGGEITGNTAQYGGGIALYNSRLVKTAGYIAGTDGGIYANDSTQSQGDAVLYCLVYTFWDRKISLTQYGARSTDNVNSGWTLLGDEGTF
jgi:hypothetical protein